MSSNNDEEKAEEVKSGTIQLKVKGVRGSINVSLHGKTKQDFIAPTDKSYKNNKDFGL